MFYPSGDFNMGLSTLVISHKQSESLGNSSKSQRRKKCQKGMTGAEKRLLRSALYLMSKKVARKNLSFLTLTLPSLSKFDLVAISNSWAEAIRRLLQELKRLLVRRGMSDTVAGCTEIQEKRWRFREEVAPHAHLVFQGKLSHGGWAIRPEEIKQIWQRILSDMLGRDLDCSAATRIEPVKKCPIAYMSKYMSKGGKTLKEITDTYGGILPTSWLIATEDLRSAVREESITPPPEVVDYLVSNLEALKKEGLISWFGRLWCIRAEDTWEIQFERDDKPIDFGKRYKKLIAVSGTFTSQNAMWEVINRGLSN